MKTVLKTLLQGATVLMGLQGSKIHHLFRANAKEGFPGSLGGVCWPRPYASSAGGATISNWGGMSTMWLTAVQLHRISKRGFRDSLLLLRIARSPWMGFLGGDAQHSYSPQEPSLWSAKDVLARQMIRLTLLA
jgi:hypothetical protein